jgi:hypothetical protein
MIASRRWCAQRHVGPHQAFDHLADRAVAGDHAVVAVCDRLTRQLRRFAAVQLLAHGDVQPCSRKGPSAAATSGCPFPERGLTIRQARTRPLARPLAILNSLLNCRQSRRALSLR